MMKDILNWRLMSGSHEFPGSEGGTCVNEAALLFAGFVYRPVRTGHDLPPCFSRPVASLAMLINDYIESDELRQELLLPFVTLLADTADVDEVELRRVRFIAKKLAESTDPGPEWTETFDMIYADESVPSAVRLVEDVFDELYWTGKRPSFKTLAVVLDEAIKMKAETKETENA